MRRNLLLTTLSLLTTTFLLGCFTPLFTPLLAHLPTHADLLFHLLAHAALSITTLQLAPSIPPEGIALASATLAGVVEIAQAKLLPDRGAQPADFIAGVVGSAAVFAVPRDGRLRKPSCVALAALVLGEEEEEEEDGHAVASWAV